MIVSNSTQTKAEIQEVINRLDISGTNPKWRKWKMQATSKESCGKSWINNWLITIKCLANNANWVRPATKKKKISGPMDIIALVSPRAK